MDAYPNAKVVLSVRDPDKWYDSVKESIYTFTKVPRDKLEKNRDTLKVSPVRTLVPVLQVFTNDVLPWV